VLFATGNCLIFSELWGQRVKGLKTTLAFSLFAFLSPVSASVVFSNFGPGDSFQSNWSYVIGSPGGTPNWTPGEQFIPSLSGYLTDVYVAISDAGQRGTGVDVTLTLRADVSGRPGEVLEELIIDDVALPDFGASTGNPVHVSASGLTNLLAGTPYWLVAEAPAAYYAWNFNDQGRFGRHTSDLVSSWQDLQGAFRVDVSSSVPEPSILELMILALAALRLCAVRSKPKIELFAFRALLSWVVTLWRGRTVVRSTIRAFRKKALFAVVMMGASTTSYGAVLDQWYSPHVTLV
jgi:hypothetical protein